MGFIKLQNIAEHGGDSSAQLPEAVEQGSGARGLRNIFSELLQPVIYELSGSSDKHFRCLLRGREIREHKPPLIHDRTALERKRKELNI